MIPLVRKDMKLDEVKFLLGQEMMADFEIDRRHSRHVSITG
jgi:hypothetical protein